MYMFALPRRAWDQRIIRWGVVAATCTFIQEVVLYVLYKHYGIDKLWANAWGYTVSWQINFVASAFVTWGDRIIQYPVMPVNTRWLVRSYRRVQPWARRWLAFSCVALAALLVNQVVFKAALYVPKIPVLLASLVGISVGAVVTFGLNNVVTFTKPSPNTQTLENTIAPEVPDIERVRAATEGKTFVCFLPVYNEEENLWATVKQIYAYLSSLSFSAFRIVVVNDGSKDKSANLAEVLAFAHPEVVVYAHTKNRGYGGALATGMNAACVERLEASFNWWEAVQQDLPFNWWGFVDADMQIPHEYFGALFIALYEEAADLSIGYRLTRESRARQLLGHAWQTYSRFIVGWKLLSGIHDIDGGMKVGTVNTLAQFAPRLFGAKAAISPELVARSRMAGARIAQRPVAYVDRTAGTSTGDNPKVILISGMHVLLVGLSLRIERLFNKSLRMAPKPRGGVVRSDGWQKTAVSGRVSAEELEAVPVPVVTDIQTKQKRRPRLRTSWLVAAGALVSTITALVVTTRLHGILLYGDAMSHLEVPRRMIDGSTPGLAQMGGVWPPFYHWLIMMFAWYNPFYMNGFAGSIVSMVAYIVASVLVYKIVAQLTESQFLGVVSAAVLALNTNMLYMGVIPMTEATFFATLAGMIYCTQQWILTDQSRWLDRGIIAAICAALTRYEVWFILPFYVLVVYFVARRRTVTGLNIAVLLDHKILRARARDRYAWYSFWALAIPIGSWMGWNWAIFKDPFAFQTGAYAQPALWLTSHEPAIGHLPVAVKTYLIAMADKVPWPFLVMAAVAIVGICLLMTRHKRILWQYMPTLAMYAVVPFFIWALYKGQRPLHVPPIERDLYNVRFGLLPLLPTAVLVGVLIYFISKAFRSRTALYGLGTLVLLLTGFLSSLNLLHHGPVTYREALGSQNPVVHTVAKAFEHYYTGGEVLAQSFGNEGFIFVVPSKDLIYEGSYQKWGPDRRAPSINGISWIMERCGPQADLVCTTVNPGEIARYKLVWEVKLPDGTAYKIYHVRRSFLTALHGAQHAHRNQLSEGGVRNGHGA